jgi:hypothetical protein
MESCLFGTDTSVKLNRQGSNCGYVAPTEIVSKCELQDLWGSQQLLGSMSANRYVYNMERLGE